MKKAICFIFACMIPAMGVFGLLPPLAQSTREIQAILSDSRTYEYLGGGQIIQNVTKTRSGYVVMTQDYLMRVDIGYLQSQTIGPAVFECHFYHPVSLETGLIISSQTGELPN